MYATEEEQETLGENVVKSMGIINPFCYEEFPYHEVPKASSGDPEVVVFPISELEERRNSFPIPIPLLDVTVENIRALYYITKVKFLQDIIFLLFHFSSFVTILKVLMFNY